MAADLIGRDVGPFDSAFVFDATGNRLLRIHPTFVEQLKENTGMAERMLNEQVARRFMMASCVAATLAAIVTTGLSFGGVLGGNLFNLLDVAIFAGLAFGVYRTSRTCAIALLVYHLGNRFIMYRRSEDPATAFGLLAIAMTAAYFLGVLGTFAIHAIEAEKRAATGSSRMLKNYS